MGKDYDVWAVDDYGKIDISSYERLRASKYIAYSGAQQGASLSEIRQVLCCLGLVSEVSGE